MPKFKDIREFVDYYEKAAKTRGGRNDWRVQLAMISCTLPEDATDAVFFEDYYVYVVLSEKTNSMAIDRKANDNPVFVRKNGEVIRTHGEWTLCQRDG